MPRINEGGGKTPTPKPPKYPLSTKNSEKPLPKRYYAHGGQGTLVYSPDIIVQIATDEYGVRDVSNHIVDFSLTRRVNEPSTFQCTLDNKFSRYDRVIRRMDRIVVFLKRIEWMQVFSGYITDAPWQTVVPGNIQIVADCTLKRLVHTYWDATSSQAQELFPALNSSSFNSADGGAAATMFKLLTVIGDWSEFFIHIQKIPTEWLLNAAAIAVRAKETMDADPARQIILQEFKKILDADGWSGSDKLSRYGLNGTPTTTSSNPTTTSSGIDAAWQTMVGKPKPPGGIFPKGFGSGPSSYSGFVDDTKMERIPVSAHGINKSGRGGPTPVIVVQLRPDAAYSFRSLRKQLENKVFLDVSRSYMDYTDQILDIRKYGGDLSACTNVEKCPAGASDHGWGTAIDINQSSDFFSWAMVNTATMNKFGWVQDLSTHSEHWLFVGSDDHPAWVRMTNGKIKRAAATDPTATEIQAQNDAGTAASQNGPFNYQFFYPTYDVQSDIYTGERAWFNDVKLIDSVMQASNASLRDFQSAPNGDFISFFPDRLGVYGKLPVVKVRDIEVVDFKLGISDRELVTHYAVAGDIIYPEPHTGVDIEWLMTAGIVSIEQNDIMEILLGISPADAGKYYKNMPGDWMLQRFGIRPMKEQMPDIRDFKWEFMLALHRFQEQWSKQWQTDISLTFMPEIYPGMRIELEDQKIAVYVEAVTHNGSRSGGFNTEVTISTPMVRDGDHWKLLSMEEPPTQEKIPTMIDYDIPEWKLGY